MVDHLFAKAGMTQTEDTTAAGADIIRLDRQIAIPHFERLELSAEITSQLGDLEASKLGSEHTVQGIGGQRDTGK